MLLAFAAWALALPGTPPLRDDFAELAPIRGRLHRYDIARKVSLASVEGRPEENHYNG